MFNRDWIRQHIQLERSVTGIKYDGIPLGLTQSQVRVLVTLMERGQIYSSTISESEASAKVMISHIRSALDDMGLPFTISKNHNGPMPGGGVYYLHDTATLGGRKPKTGDKNGSINSASPSADCLQDVSRGTAR